MSFSAQELLEAAGFRRFWEARQENTDRPARVAATADLDDVRLIEPEAMVIPPDTVIKRLVHKVLKAEGYDLGDRFVVLPGADYCYDRVCFSNHATCDHESAIVRDFFKTGCISNLTRIGFSRYRKNRSNAILPRSGKSPARPNG